MSIMVAHIFMGFYSFLKRNSLLRICEHKQDKHTGTLLTMLCILFLPFLGAVTATLQSIEEGTASVSIRSTKKKTHILKQSNDQTRRLLRKKLVQNF